jgi:hypothetical protein
MEKIGSGKEGTMVRRCSLLALIPALLYLDVASADDYPIMKAVAAKVVQKYQNSSCEDLAAQKKQPPTDAQKKAVQALRGNPQMRTEFMNIVAGPIANKLFECGMIP